MNKKLIMALMGMTAAAGIASAATVTISSDITSSTTWVSTNVYELNGQIYVDSGATLTIEAGTLVQTPTNYQGSLAVCRGAKIYVNGTEDNPVIMTSSEDTLTSWHEGCNEWGNLTLMGNALISGSHYKGAIVDDNGTPNTKYPTGLNQKQMEGLTAASTDPEDVAKVLYGGADDDDDSGSIHYLSLRYGGKVVGLANELNGLSMGGIGRETDVDHVEIMNNVDDGIETWGGTVNYKYISIWNIGDDSFDIDEGWRGKAQFGLIVQGYSVDAAQGSGVGDNCFETDGAEQSDAQPVTTAKIANFTVIGTLDGDHATAWRDNARIQYHNCIFMDIGARIVAFDCFDTDGGLGYGYNGTLSWSDTWLTSYTNYSAVNWTNTVYSDPSNMYTAQNSGNLAEIKGCLVYRSNALDYPGDSKDMAFAGDSSYTQSDSKGYGTAQTGYPIDAFNGTYDNPQSNINLDNLVVSSSPIVSYTRGPIFSTSYDGGLDIEPVTNINPRAANDALTVETPETADEFLVAAPFRGGFSADNNWLEGWTAVYAYGMTTDSNSADPAATIQITASTFFQTEAGVVYTVEESSDMKTWAPVATVTGDGSIMSATDLDAFDSAKFYRAIIL
ncbi:MAG: hypothetical protein AB7E95_04155 [Kiritimatiellales bacterium]